MKIQKIGHDECRTIRAAVNAALAPLADELGVVGEGGEVATMLPSVEVAPHRCPDCHEVTTHPARCRECQVVAGEVTL